LHTWCGAFRFGAPITLTADDVAVMAETLPSAKIVLIHLNALNHCGEKRAFCKNRLHTLSNVNIPGEGEEVVPVS